MPNKTAVTTNLTQPVMPWLQVSVLVVVDSHTELIIELDGKVPHRQVVWVSRKPEMGKLSNRQRSDLYGTGGDWKSWCGKACLLAYNNYDMADWGGGVGGPLALRGFRGIGSIFTHTHTPP